MRDFEGVGGESPFGLRECCVSFSWSAGRQIMECCGDVECLVLGALVLGEGLSAAMMQHLAARKDYESVCSRWMNVALRQDMWRAARL